MIFNKLKKSTKLNNIIMYSHDVLINTITNSFVTPCIIRKAILNIETHGNIYGTIHGKFYLESNNFSLGRNSYINRFCSIYNASGSVAIGDNCALAYNVSIHTTNHDYSNSERRAGFVKGEDVVIEDGCWVGAGVTILPGVTIGSGCVIGAGSLVVSDCEPHHLYAGVPARKIRKL